MKSLQSSVSPEIVSLTEATMERVRPQVNYFGKDPLRRTENGGVILSPDTSVIYGEGLHPSAGEYGHMVLQVSGVKAARNFIGEVHASAIYSSSFSKLTAENPVCYRSEEWIYPSIAASIKVQKDVYPAGVHPDVIAGWPKEDERELGDLHRVAIDLGYTFRHKKLPLTHRHTRTIMLENRFDNEVPQLITSHVWETAERADGEVKRDEELYEEASNPATLADIDQVRRLLLVPKHLRPVVSPPRKPCRYW